MKNVLWINNLTALGIRIATEESFNFRLESAFKPLSGRKVSYLPNILLYYSSQGNRQWTVSHEDNAEKPIDGMWMTIGTQGVTLTHYDHDKAWFHAIEETVDRAEIYSFGDVIINLTNLALLWSIPKTVWGQKWHRDRTDILKLHFKL